MIHNEKCKVILAEAGIHDQMGEVISQYAPGFPVKPGMTWDAME